MYQYHNNETIYTLVNLAFYLVLVAPSIITILYLYYPFYPYNTSFQGEFVISNVVEILCFMLCYYIIHKKYRLDFMEKCFHISSIVLLTSINAISTYLLLYYEKYKSVIFLFIAVRLFMGATIIYIMWCHCI
jgi:hypothetical protein